MPKFKVDKKRLEKLLRRNNIPISDAVKRGKFYEEFYDWDGLSKDYADNKYSILDICKKLNLSYDTVRVNLIRKLGKLHEFRRVSSYTFREDLLYPMSNIGAYFMGWLYSDGYMVESTMFGITLSAKDTEQLSYLAGLVSDKSVTVKNNKVTFNFYSVELAKKLQKDFKVFPNKSHKNFTIPLELYNNCLPYLLLGLLEGDGSISKSSCCSLLLTSNTWNVIREAIKGFVDLSSMYERPLNDYGLLNVIFSGKSYFSLLQYIYCNTPEIKPLKRKYERFTNQLQKSMNGRTSPYKKLAVNVWDSLNNTRKC